jgi:thioredoxin reductase
MMNVYRVLPGKKVLMIGSGNVGLIVSYQLKQAGADVVGIIEALPSIGGYKVHASKVRRMNIPILTSYTIKEAKGNPEVSSAIITKIDKDFHEIPETEEEIKCDLICLAVGLKPFDELCWLLKLKFEYIPELGGFVPVHDENLQTSMNNVYIAGDAAGVEEASCAMEEGRLVGITIAQKFGYIEKQKAEKLKKEIKIRLDQLRLGSFGDERAKGKIQLIQARGR